MIFVPAIRFRRLQWLVGAGNRYRKSAMGKVQVKMRLDDVLTDSESIEPSSQRQSQDARKQFRAVRKRQMRDAELRIRRQHALRKKLGIK